MNTPPILNSNLSPSHPSELRDSKPLSRLDLGLMLGLLLLGSGLRLLWAADMEWKADEIWMYDTARQVADGDLPWPWLGMTSSTGLQNPGLSVWPFILLAYVAETPVAMVRWVQGINIAVLWGLFGFFYWQWPQERQSWLWGIALAAVSPLAILFSRKLWTIDLLPLFCAAILITHTYRHRRWGAFGWGLVGALIGQLHMSGFFLATALFLWTVYRDHRQHTLAQIRWISWGVGTVLGLIPFVPWVIYAASADNQAAQSWVGLLVPKYFAHWFTTALGVNMSYSLGRHFWSGFLPQPIIGGHPTYLLALVHGVLVLIGLWYGFRWVRSMPRPIYTLRTPVAPPLGFYGQAFGWMTGLIFALFALNIPVHYVFIGFPMMYVWLASVMAQHRRPWFLLLAGQVVISVAFLVFIHATGGFADADYGLVYRLQVPNP